MAFVKHWTASALTEVTTTSNTVWSDMATLTLLQANLEASTDYIIFWDGAFNANTNSSDVQFRVTIDGTQKVLANLEAWRTSPLDYTHTGGFFRYQTGGTVSADVVIKIQFKSETSGVTSASKNTHLTAIKLPPNGAYQESTSRVTSTSATYADGVSVTFTPPSTSDYIILACGFVDTAATFGGAGNVRLSDGTNTTTGLGLIGYDTTNLVPFVLGWSRTGLTASSKTMKLQYAIESGSGITMGLSEQRILALRVADFDAVYSAFLATDDGNTTATYTDTALTLTQTTSANDHLQLGMWFQEGTSSSLSNYTRLQLDGSDVGEMVHTTIDATSDESGHGVFMHQTGALTAASHTWKVQRKSETTSTFTVVKRQGAIIVFDLGSAAAGGALTGVTGTGAAGTVAPANSKALTGNAATAAVGTTVPTISRALTGVSATASLGTLAPSTSKALSGNAGTGAVGTVSAGGSVTAALTGVSAAGSVGTLSPALSKSLSGSAATGSTGSLTAFSSLSLTGVAATGAAGSLGRAISIALTGNSATGSVGSVSRGGDVIAALTGVTATGSVGVLTAHAFGWTPVPPVTGSWTAVSAASGIWTSVPPTSTDWTEQ